MHKIHTHWSQQVCKCQANNIPATSHSSRKVLGGRDMLHRENSIQYISGPHITSHGFIPHKQLQKQQPIIHVSVGKCLPAWGACLPLSTHNTQSWGDEDLTAGSRYTVLALWWQQVYFEVLYGSLLMKYNKHLWYVGWKQIIQAHGELTHCMKWQHSLAPLHKHLVTNNHNCHHCLEIATSQNLN